MSWWPRACRRSLAGSHDWFRASRQGEPHCRRTSTNWVEHPFANRWLNLAIAWELVLLGVIIYVPWFHAPFATFSFSVDDWILVTALTFTVVPVLEAVKWMERHEWFGELK